MHDGPLLVTVSQLDADSIQVAIEMLSHMHASKVLISMHTRRMPCMKSPSKVLTGVLCSDLQGGHEEAEKQAYTRGVDCTSLT